MIFRCRLLKKILVLKVETQQVNAGIYMAIWHSVSFGTILTKIFGLMVVKDTVDVTGWRLSAADIKIFLTMKGKSSNLDSNLNSAALPTTWSCKGLISRQIRKETVWNLIIFGLLRMAKRSNYFNAFLPGCQCIGSNVGIIIMPRWFRTVNRAEEADAGPEKCHGCQSLRWHLHLYIFRWWCWFFEYQTSLGARSW